MESKNLRYIVFLLDDRAPHYLEESRVSGMQDGKIYTNKNDAREYAMEAIKDGYCNRFVVGIFYLEPDHEVMPIGLVETYGFKNDKKNVVQLSLFK